jgi:prepilin-type processing-associated H-X9-DG protein/prepilin-type N-terminal cleavage/methylation domain-containing protein
MEHSRKTNRGTAFTLIELLVVIAIIALLAAILFPVFAQAREKARASACVSNLKQLGLAFEQYIQDYDEFYPFGNYTYNGGRGWAGQVYPYVKSTKVFICPSDPNPNDGMSYAMNSNMSEAGGSSYYAVPVSKLASPAKSVLSFEITNEVSDPQLAKGDPNSCSPVGNGNNWWAGGALTGCNYSSGSFGAASLKYCTGVLYNACAVSTSGSYTSCITDPTQITPTNSYYLAAGGIHQNGANYLLCDGHVKFLQPTMVGAGADYLGDNWVATNYYTTATCPPGLYGRPGNAPTVDCTNPIAVPASFALH